jgi:hypothetical protein
MRDRRTPEADRRSDDMAKAAEKGLRKAASDNAEAEPATPNDDGLSRRLPRSLERRAINAQRIQLCGISSSTPVV